MFKYKLSSSNKLAPEECFFLALEDSRLLKLDNLLLKVVEDVCGVSVLALKKKTEITHPCTMSIFLIELF